MESNWRRHRGGGDDEDGWRMNSRENRGKTVIMYTYIREILMF